MKMSGVKERFNELKKKHALPDFDGLNNEFEVSGIENKDFLLREIRRKMDERVEAFLKMLNTVLQPETNIAELHECREFSEKDKEDIYRLFKRLMLMHDSSLLAGISCSEEEDARFISDTFKEWSKIKGQMKDILSKMRDAWKNDTNIKEELGYLG